jgi:hypothetical protein
MSRFIWKLLRDKNWNGNQMIGLIDGWREPMNISKVKGHGDTL